MVIDSGKSGDDSATAKIRIQKSGSSSDGPTADMPAIRCRSRNLLSGKGRFQGGIIGNSGKRSAVAASRVSAVRVSTVQISAAALSAIEEKDLR